MPLKIENLMWWDALELWYLGLLIASINPSNFVIFKFCWTTPPPMVPKKKKQVKQPKINRPLGWVINLWLAVYFVLPFEKEKLSWMSLKKVTKFLYLTLFLHLFWGLYSLIVKVPKRLQLWSHGEHQSTNDHDPTHWMALIVHLLSSFIIVTFLFLKYN